MKTLILAIAAFAAGIFLGVNLTLYSVWWQSGAGE